MSCPRCHHPAHDPQACLHADADLWCPCWPGSGQPIADHPHTDPGDGRTECDICGKWIYPAIHSCKGLPVTEAARQRWNPRHPDMQITTAR